MAVVPFALLGGFRGCHSRGVFQGVPLTYMAVVVLRGLAASVGRQCAVPRLALVRELTLVILP